MQHNNKNTKQVKDIEECIDTTQDTQGLLKQNSTDDFTLLKANSSCYNTAPVAVAVRTSNPKVEYNKKRPKKPDTDAQKDCYDVSQVTSKDSCTKFGLNPDLFCIMETKLKDSSNEPHE